MTIRRAMADDIEAIVSMGLKFQATSEYAAHLRTSSERLRRLAIATLINPDAAFWLAESVSGEVVGMLAAGLHVQPMSEEVVGHEIVWWMDPAARGGRAAIGMLRAAEEWAKGRGATIFQMMAPNAHVGSFYERLGYAPIETHYQRRFE